MSSLAQQLCMRKLASSNSADLTAKDQLRQKGDFMVRYRLAAKIVNSGSLAKARNPRFDRHRNENCKVFRTTVDGRH
jgi:hypothetical protein